MKSNPYFPELQYPKRFEDSVPTGVKIAIPIVVLVFATVMAFVFGEPSGASDAAAVPAPTERVIVETSRRVEAEEKKLWLSLWVHTDYMDREDEKKLVESFDNSDKMQWIKAETKFAMYDDSHPRYQRQEFRDAFPVLPCVVLQKPNGEVLEKWSGDEIPWTYGMARTLRQHIEGKEVERKRGLFKRRQDCPNGECLPLPPPNKEQAIREDEEREEVEPPPEPEPDLPFPTMLALGGGLFALAAGVLIGVARYKSK